ncbi:hypothetical protein BJF78_29295 [Pseudonocardia sp. CNS-139]|nr:hypothetical protein BJF78_29295 [Pseudonocardia sp. CNS-139]
MVRMGAAVIALEGAALAVAYAYFGWPVLLVGVPALVGTLLMLLFVRLSQAPLRRLQEHRAARWDPDAAVPGGLMSGFFEVAGVPANRRR